MITKNYPKASWFNVSVVSVGHFLFR